MSAKKKKRGLTKRRAKIVGLPGNELRYRESGMRHPDTSRGIIRWEIILDCLKIAFLFTMASLVYSDKPFGFDKNKLLEPHQLAIFSIVSFLLATEIISLTFRVIPDVYTPMKVFLRKWMGDKLIYEISNRPAGINEKALKVIRGVAEEQLTMRVTPGENSIQLLREGRSGKMYGK